LELRILSNVVVVTFTEAIDFLCQKKLDDEESIETNFVSSKLYIACELTYNSLRVGYFKSNLLSDLSSVATLSSKFKEERRKERKWK